jgi:hypothetical protein
MERTFSSEGIFPCYFGGCIIIMLRRVLIDKLSLCLCLCLCDPLKGSAVFIQVLYD